MDEIFAVEEKQVLRESLERAKEARADAEAEVRPILLVASLSVF